MSTPFFIDHIAVDPPIVLAPMEGVTDRAFRTLVRSLGGCGLAVTEFVSSEGLTREIEASWRMAEIDPGEHPVSIQIYGRDPGRMAQAAAFCQGIGADIVDINLGCPSKTVTTGCAGSALMREPELAAEIFSAVFEAISIPMTVKMRLGWNHEQINAPKIAERAVAIGAKMIAVHGRTKSDGYKGHSRWEMIREVKEAIDVPVLVNGDIIGPEQAWRALELSGADGVMVGRAVMSDPWTLARIACAFRGEDFEDPSIEARRLALHGYLDRVEVDGHFDRKTLMRVKQVVGYFSKGLHQAARLRKGVNLAADFAGVRALVDEFFAFHELRWEVAL
ncbi:MAG: tRNA dihydrouridine synthase DusB [Bradymonadaceae bacterium]|nr:tRNA dihydrouridine synthase DusB [Lujinxingiaceae bacterium]